MDKLCKVCTLVSLIVDFLEVYSLKKKRNKYFEVSFYKTLINVHVAKFDEMKNCVYVKVILKTNNKLSNGIEYPCLFENSPTTKGRSRQDDQCQYDISH